MHFLALGQKDKQTSESFSLRRKGTPSGSVWPKPTFKIFKMEATRKSEEKLPYVPNDWNDDDRMSFMFSAFPKDRNVNPKHWDSKMNYWIEEIKNCCMFNRDICMSCEKLRNRMKRNERFPQGLSTVISQMERQGMLTSPEYVLGALDNSWMKWGFGIAKGSAKWIWGSIWKAPGTEEQKDYVVYETLENVAMELLAKHQTVAKNDKTDHVVPWNVVKNLYVLNDKKLTDEELLLVIAFLKRKKFADMVSNPQGEKLVKFAKNNSTVHPVSETDWHIIKVKKAIAKLKMESAEARKELAKLQDSAQMYIKQGDKNQAKRQLLQKRKLERLFNMKQDTLLTLTDQLITIQNSESNKMVMDAISSSAAVLSSSAQEDGLSLDKIDDVFEKSIEALDFVKDINVSVSQGLKQADDEAELQQLENELAELMAEKEEEPQEEALDVLDLPRVPTHSPLPLKPEAVVKKKVRTLAL